MGGRIAVINLKHLLFGRAPVAVLRAAISTYCRRAAESIERILGLSGEQLDLWRAVQRSASRDWDGVLQDWMDRLIEHRERQQLALARLKAAALDPHVLDDGVGPLHGALRAATLAGAVGVTPRELLEPASERRRVDL